MKKECIYIYKYYLKTWLTILNLFWGSKFQPSEGLLFFLNDSSEINRWAVIKTLVTFHCTGWFIGSLITAYQNAHITYNCVILLDFEDKKIDDAIPFLQIAASGTHQKNLNSQKKNTAWIPLPLPFGLPFENTTYSQPCYNFGKNNWAKKPAKTKIHRITKLQTPGIPPALPTKKTSPNNLKLQNPQLTQYFFRARTWALAMADRDSPGFFVPSDSWVLEDSLNDGDRWEKSRSPT